MISGGSRHTAVLDSNGDLYMCGCNNEGQTGLWSCDLKRLSFRENIVSVSCGKLHTVSAGASGFAYGWGNNTYNQLGTSKLKNIEKPSKIQEMSDICFVACGSYYTMCVDSEGVSWAFGENDQGQLGTGGWGKEPEPVPDWALDFQEIKAVACGESHTIFLTKEGRVFSTGSNRNGQLGTGKISFDKYSHFPTEVAVEDTIIKILCGDDFTVLVDSYGGVWVMGQCTDCLGENCSSQVLVPTIIPDLRVTSIACGSDFVVCIDEENQLLTWGRNVTFIFKIANEDRLPRIIKQRVVGVGCGLNTVFINTGRCIKCTGINADGQLGLGDREFVYKFKRKNYKMNERMFEQPMEIEKTIPRCTTTKSAQK